MELKEFIIKTINDVADAINECKKNGMTRVDVAHKEKNADIEFDIAITVDEKCGETDGIGGGIRVLGVELKAGVEEKNEIEKSKASRIKFGINNIHKI